MPELSPSTGLLLVATPELADPNFTHTVIFLLAVRAEGALGVVLNRPSLTRVDEVLPRWAATAGPPAVMFFGGPVGLESVIGLVGTAPVDLNGEPTIEVETASTLRLFAGSAGWGEDQLAAEIEAGSWWVFEAEDSDVHTSDPSNLWAEVLRRQGGRTAWFALATASPDFN